MATVAGRTEGEYDPDAPLTRHSPAGAVVLAYLRGQVAAIRRYDPLVRVDEPDALHQMRVACRRARTEVLCDRLTAGLAVIPAGLVEGPVQARISAHFAAELAQARRIALAALDGQRYLRLLDDLNALLADPPLAPPAAREAGEVLAKPVRRAARRLQRALDAVPGAEDHDTAIHQARKAAKRARYAAEAAVPAIGRTASRQAAQTKKLQQLLGDHHDSVVARTALLDLAGKARAAGEDTFTYGLMYQCQACQATTIEEALPRESAGLA
jgi:CHAD domain-containing protein